MGINNKRIGWTKIEDVAVFLIDFSELKGDILREHILHCCLEADKIESKTLFYIDFSNSKMTFELTNYLVEVSKRIQPNVQKSVILGVKGYKRFLFFIYSKLTKSKAKLFEDKNLAFKYLVSR